jgi:hypothetical protein
MRSSREEFGLFFRKTCPEMPPRRSGSSGVSSRRMTRTAPDGSPAPVTGPRAPMCSQSLAPIDNRHRPAGSFRLPCRWWRGLAGAGAARQVTGS